MELSFNGSAGGHHTLADAEAFIAACKQLGMPAEATLLSAKTKLFGNGPLKTITAVWDEQGVPRSPSAPPVTHPTTTAETMPLIPGLPDRSADPTPVTTTTPGVTTSG